MKIRNSLDWFTLYYEEFEKEKMSKTKVAQKTSESKVNIKQRVSSVFNAVRVKISSVTGKIFHRKKAKKLTKDEKKARREQQKRGILGIGELFAVLSIAYSSYVILNGVNTVASKVMLAPQIAFAIYKLVKAFSKIYK